MEWQEAARWIKFEENVEDSNRWGKPNVASLTFHSLLELRKGLEKGTVLLDLEKLDLPSIAEAVVDNMVITDKLSQTDSNKVLAALLLRHRHQTSAVSNRNGGHLHTTFWLWQGRTPNFNGSRRF
ncbi:Anion exchange protein 3 [Desmophyllum pertusum]|uniref:Anion exchange protein 3 n=1 Tax=Desmophyllum pertusum TaxID=174260 RepID=A0A9W9ZHI9_9CNID|nr:Anion exchange protein 3 [Desmophyllum pertusum]